MQINDALARHLLLSHPIPGWTLADRKQHLTGSGVFDIEFDYESGRVREVRVLKSTGHESLDGNIVAGLKRWRAKKAAIHVLRLPITYAVGSVDLGRDARAFPN